MNYDEGETTMTTATERTALVLGGTGFVGSHLLDRLVAEGWRVVVPTRVAWSPACRPACARGPGDR